MGSAILILMKIGGIVLKIVKNKNSILKMSFCGFKRQQSLFIDPIFSHSTYY